MNNYLQNSSNKKNINIIKSKKKKINIYILYSIILCLILVYANIVILVLPHNKILILINFIISCGFIILYTFKIIQSKKIEDLKVISSYIEKIINENIDIYENMRVHITDKIKNISMDFDLNFLVEDEKKIRELKRNIEEKLRSNSFVSLDDYEKSVSQLFDIIEKKMKLIVDKIFIEIEGEKNRLDNLNKDFDEFKLMEKFLEIYDKWFDLIEGSLSEKVKILNDRVDYVNSYSKKSDQMIKNINKELNAINSKINSLKGKEEKDITGFFNRINKQQRDFIEQFRLILEKSSDISEKFELIEELSSKISLIAFNIEIQASKTQYNKVFSVLAKEVRDFSDQMHKYYKGMSVSFVELNDFIKKNEENIANFQKEVIDKIQMANDVFSKYDESMINIQQILLKLINESENQKHQFISKTNENFSTMQSLAINLEQMQHRSSTIIYFLNIYKQKIHNLLSLNNDNILKDEKILIEEILRYIESIITTSEERLFVNKLYKEYLNKEIKLEDIHIENKARKAEKGSEDSDSVIIF